MSDIRSELNKARERDRILREAETIIRSILINVDEKISGLGKQVSSIEVDTRMFANMSVSVNIEDKS